MELHDQSGGAGPRVRRQLAGLFVGAALSGGGGVIKGVPIEYQIELLARRWGITPYDLERAMDDPIVQKHVARSLQFMALEAVEVRGG